MDPRMFRRRTLTSSVKSPRLPVEAAKTDPSICSGEVAAVVELVKVPEPAAAVASRDGTATAGDDAVVASLGT